MAAPSSQTLQVKTSTLPNAGKGLFTKVAIAKGAVVTEYEGRRCKWKDVEADADNAYIYHIDDDHVIDASDDEKSFGRYANDASGLQRIAGIKNNAEYYEEGKSVFIKATKNIPAGSEVLVPYGKLYWKQIKENIKIEAAAASK